MHFTPSGCFGVDNQFPIYYYLFTDHHDVFCEMATGGTSNRCSICQKSGGSCICGGCKAFFCKKHFLEHHQQLSLEFDREVVRTHDELLEQINKTKASNKSYVNLFSQIDRWEKVTIEKINKVAEKVRRQLTQLINSERETLTEEFGILTKEIQNRREEDDFVEDDIKQLQQKLHQLQRSLVQQTQPDKVKVIIMENDQIDWDRLIYAEQTKETALQCVIDIPANAKWTQNGITVAGGNQKGNEFKQLSSPWGLYVADDQTVYIADYGNHRIVEWRRGATSGQIVAGGNGQGNRSDQLNLPTDVLVDEETDSLIICDNGNRRVVQWPRRSGKSGQTIISEINCIGLTMDNDGFLYVSDWDNQEVRRWRVGETRGTVVAGANGAGHRLDQLNGPRYVFVDRDHSVYVSDRNNHRVMKWVQGAKEGVVVAGGQGKGNALTQLSDPQGVIVDQLGNVYVADSNNYRIMRWPKGATQGSIVVGGNNKGEQVNQLSHSEGMSFDRHGNFYVADYGNHRVQRFSIDYSSRS